MPGVIRIYILIQLVLFFVFLAVLLIFPKLLGNENVWLAIFALVVTGITLGTIAYRKVLDP